MSNQAQEIQSFLEKTLNDLSGLTRENMFGTVNTLDSVLIRCYDEKTAYMSDLKKIRIELRKLLDFNEDIPSLGWSLDEVKGWYKNLLESMISELNLIGLPSKNDIKIDKSINVYVNQTQSQEQIQKQSIDNFIESIKMD